MTGWIEGFAAIASWSTLVMIPIGVALGIAIGAIPGLTATVGMALFLPFVFSLEPLQGLALLLGIYNGAAYSGAIPAVLIKMPGTPAAAATTIDGYPMSQKGRAGEALTISLVASVIGGFLGALALSFAAPVLARYALNFGSAEFFAIAVLALTVIISIGSEAKLTKGLISAMLGFLIVAIGFDPIAGFPRFTFGTTQLQGGIELIPLLVGLFGLGEAFTQMEKLSKKAAPKVSPGKFTMGRGWVRRLGPTMVGSTVVGFGTGLLPGVGGDVGGYMAYNETRRFAKDKTQFGKGDPRGVAASEAANNASDMGSLVSTFALGIPGNAQSALLLGALLIIGVQPGPNLFTSNSSLVFGAFATMMVGYALTLIIGQAGIRFWIRVVSVPPRMLWPGVMVLSVIGSFAVRSNVFDVLVTIGAGVLGYVLTRNGFPLAPVLIGVIVGPIAEQNFRRSMISSQGSYEWMLQPLTLTILIVAAVALAFAIWARVRASRRLPVL